MSVVPVVPISAIEHFAYCPRQCALIHCDGIWADNEHTVKGTRAHRRVDSGAHRQERGHTVLRSIPLWSEVLHLSGRSDAVKIDHDGNVNPVEYKAGIRHGNTADLQLCAQAICLEEMLGVEISLGYVWYVKPRRQTTVSFTIALRKEVHDIVEKIRRQLLDGKLPSHRTMNVAAVASCSTIACPSFRKSLARCGATSRKWCLDALPEYRLCAQPPHPSAVSARMHSHFFARWKSANPA